MQVFITLFLYLCSHSFSYFSWIQKKLVTALNDAKLEKKNIEALAGKINLLSRLTFDIFLCRKGSIPKTDIYYGRDYFDSQAKTFRRQPEPEST